MPSENWLHIYQAENDSIPQNLKGAVLKSVLEKSTYGYFVTPKNADAVSACAARLIAMTVNKALNPNLTYAEMEELKP